MQNTTVEIWQGKANFSIKSILLRVHTGARQKFKMRLGGVIPQSVPLLGHPEAVTIELGRQMWIWHSHGDLRKPYCSPPSFLNPSSEYKARANQIIAKLKNCTLLIGSLKITIHRSLQNPNVLM
jgi:hypothetical protein